MVTKFVNIIEFTNELSLDEKFAYEAKLADNYIIIFPASFRDKIAMQK